MFFRKKNKEKFYEFGTLKVESFDFERIESYFRKKNQVNNAQILSDKTCNDLDFHELFMYLDRTTSRVGQQYLYNKLRTIPLTSANNDIHEKLINDFTLNANLRTSIQSHLSKLNQEEALFISSLFQDEHVKPPQWYFLIQFLCFTSVLSVILLLITPQIAFVLFGVFIINTIIHYWNKKNLYHYLGSIPQLLILNNVAREFSKIDRLKVINPDVIQSINFIDKLKSRLAFFNMEVKLQADFQAFFWLIFELLKIIFLIEPLFLFGALRRIEDKRNKIEEVFTFVGEIDAIISIASLRKGESQYCIPKIDEKPKTIQAKNVCHPLIDKCISNSIHIDKKSILLTGSNMSGKTSFIRTIGVNVICGLTLNTCFAKEFSMSRLKVFSAIRISDDLLNDKSYYFEEVLTIKKMIDESNKGNNLFLLDEIFKGTNTVERISAGKAVLSALEKNNNIVFVSTHDIELADLLKEEYDLYHFSEVVGDNTVDFDYQLKSGKLKNRNAIRILQINGYPDSIINEAITLSKELCPEK